MYFEHGYYLILILLTIPVVIYYLKPVRVKFSSTFKLRDYSTSRGVVALISPLDLLLFLVGVVSLIVALARPGIADKESKKVAEGIDIMLGVDASGSMAALDFKIGTEHVSRLDAVKSVIKNFILERPNDRIGMVVFGTNAYTQIPLTLDHNVFNMFLDRVEIGIAGDSTAVGDAIAVATNRLKDVESKTKVVILLTDGVSNAGTLSPKAAASAAAGLGIRVYTIGIGQQGPVPIPQDTVFGKRIVQAELPVDEASLKEIAAKTDAKFFKASDTTSLQEIYDLIDKLEKTRMEINDNKRYTDIFDVFLLIGLSSLLLLAVFNITRFKRLA